MVWPAGASASARGAASCRSSHHHYQQLVRTMVYCVLRYHGHANLADTAAVTSGSGSAQRQICRDND